MKWKMNNFDVCNEFCTLKYENGKKIFWFWQFEKINFSFKAKIFENSEAPQNTTISHYLFKQFIHSIYIQQWLAHSHNHETKFHSNKLFQLNSLEYLYNFHTNEFHLKAFPTRMKSQLNFIQNWIIFFCCKNDFVRFSVKRIMEFFSFFFCSMNFIYLKEAVLVLELKLEKSLIGTRRLNEN